MPPSQRSSGRSADESNSEGRLSRRSSKYIDIDIAGDAVKTKSRSSQLRSDRGRSRRIDAGNGDKELHINLQIEVGDRTFYLHKFPLLSKSNKLNRLVVESRGTEVERMVLSDMPGGAQAFECLARYFYGGKVELSPYNVAAVRCAAEYLEVTGEHNNNSNLVTRIENYLNYEVSDSWRDSITVLKSCTSELIPWSEDLEIIRRCSESIAWKCCELPRKGRATDWWFDDVCSLSIDTFTRVIHAIIAKGNSGLVISAVEYYAERWLQLTKGSDMSTTMKLTAPEAASFVAFTGFNQDIVAKDAKQTQHKNRAILQGIVKLLPSPESSPSHIPSVKFLLKLLRVACLVNAGSFCKTDLTKRIASQLEKVSVDDLLIPASGESTYDVDVVQQIVEFYIQEQSYDNSPPLSPRSSVSTLTSSVSSSSLSSASLSTASRSSRSTESRSSLSDSASDSESDSGSSISGSSSSRSYRSGRSFRSGSSQVSGSSRSSSGTGSSTSRSSSSMSYTSGSFSESSSEDSSGSSTSSSRSGDSSDESVKLEIKKKAFYATDTSNASRAAPLPPTSANFKVAQLLETYLEEVAKDSSIAFAQFLKLVELFTEFPRGSDDSIYRAIDGFLRTHPSLADADRKSLCRLMDTGALSLAASVHAASNERLPLRVIVQLLFNEQIKIRNEMTGNDVINEKDLGGKIPSFSSSSTSTSSTESSSRDGSSSSSSLSSGTSSTSASSGSTRKSSRSISRASSEAALNQLVIIPAPPRSPSVASSPLLGGLSVKETLRFVLAEIESLRKSVQEIETVKSKLAAIDTLQLEIEHLSSKFQDMAQDYVGMTQQVEELTKGSKQVKSGWSSGWKKVTKTFQSKDHEHKNETPPLPPLKLPSEGSDQMPVLRTSKSDTLHPKTPRADTKAAGRADSMPVTKRTPTKSNESVTLHPNTPRADASPVSKAVKVESLPPTAGNSVSSTPRGPKKETFESRDSSFRTPEQEIVPKSGEMSVKGKEGYAITAHRSHHVEDVHRRSVRSRSASPEQQKGSHRSEQKGSHRSEQKGSHRSDSVTSTSSYSITSSARSGHHRYRQRRGSTSVNKERYHRKPRSHNGHSHKEHSVDSRHRHSSATQGGQSGHHRGHHEGSVASHHTKEGSEHHSSSHRSAHRHSHHRSDDSGASGDFVARSRRSQH